MDSKYESVLLLLVFFLLLLFTSEGRECWKKPGVYLAMAIASLVFLPNLLWLYAHHFIAITYATQELASNSTSHIPRFIRPFYSVLQFSLEQIGNVAPALILYLPFMWSRQDKLLLTRFDWRFLIALGLGPLVITIIIALLSSSHLVSRWSFPFFSITGILWLAWHNPEITRKRLKIFGLIVIGLNAILLLGMLFTFLWQPLLTGKASHSDTFPGQVIASAITKQWHDTYHQRLNYIAGTHHVVVNIAAFSEDKPRAYFDSDPKQSPWINEQDMRKKGAVFVVWLKDPAEADALISNIKTRFPNLQHMTVESFARLTRAHVAPIKLWLAFLPPG